jgi:uncharacterized protein (UPF0332 family)
MNLSELLKKDIIEKIEKNENTANELIAFSKKDLKVAQDNLNAKNYEWALAIAYNAMLYGGRALMSLKGYRTKTDSHHLGVVQFCASILPKETGELVAIFNRYRTRRHDVIYGEAREVGQNEAKRAIENADRFIKIIEAQFFK